LQALDADAPVLAFEILVDAVPVPRAKATRAKPPLELSDLMPLSRDFAFVVEESVPAAEIVRAAIAAERGLIEDVLVFDLYRGPGAPEGKKSLAIEVTLQPREKTLTDAEIDAVSRKIIAAVTKATGASLRVETTLLIAGEANRVLVQKSPTTFPSASMSMAFAAGVFGRPGIVMMSPQIITMNSAPAESRTSRILTT
jgi:hypothetical protein